jgi:hypothetical protein
MPRQRVVDGQQDRRLGRDEVQHELQHHQADAVWFPARRTKESLEARMVPGANGISSLDDARDMAAAEAPLLLTDEERETLLRFARRGRTAQRLANRARIILRCAD